MTLPSSGPLSLGDIQQEFGGSPPTSISEYYKGGSYVQVYDNAPNVPSSGPISISDFYGASSNDAPAVTWVTSPTQTMTQNNYFSLQLNATNAVTYTLTSGAFPSGLSMTSGGLVTGTPGTPQTTNPVVTATSVYNVSTPQTFTFTVNAAPPPPFITSISPSSDSRTEPYGPSFATGAAFITSFTVTCTSGSGTVIMSATPFASFASAYVSPSSFSLSAGQSRSVEFGGSVPPGSITNPWFWTAQSSAGGSYTYIINRI
jgi:hypothetical protein